LAGHAAILGAGLAGLSAADALVARGWTAEVVEARDRVGGRTWSRRLVNGATIEMGAEFILAGNTEVRALAARLGLELVEKGMRYGDREPRGGIGTTREALADAVRQADRALSGLEGRPSVRELLDSLPIDAGAREAILARAETSSASSADEIPGADLAGLAHIDTEPAPSVAGGNQRLSLGLARSLGDAVRLGDPAVAVECGGSGVRVETRGGHVARADAVILAVPASVTATIEFRPVLPQAKREALAGVRYGHAAKLFVPLAEPAPPSAVLNVPERYWCWTATGECGEPVPVVSCFAGSPAGLAGLRVADGPQHWLASLAAFRPDLALEPDGAVLSTWDDDPWVGAAYSISPDPAAAAALAAPLPPLFFAGEHTAGPFSGLMEGAIRSGRRAADEAITRAT
jgi:monoamine oxidase